MSAKKNSVLILVVSELTVGLEGLNAIMREFQSLLDVIKISSLYKRYHNIRREDLNSEIVFVIRAETSLQLFDLNQIIQEATAKTFRGKKASAKILAFNNEVRMSPSAPLPDPRLCSDSLILRCAIEVQGDFCHPVLNKTLDQIYQTLRSQELTEFFAQPKAITE